MPYHTSQLQLIDQLETLSASAWPAAEVASLAGWRLRFAEGVTRRANSVWPNHAEPGPDLETKLRQAEAFYAARRAPARFQISPAAQPADLDAQLAQRGYQPVAATAVQIAPVSDILQRTRPLRAYPHFEVEVSEEYAEEWFTFYAAVEHAGDAQLDVRRAILQRIAQPTAFAGLQIGGETAAVGLGVLEAGWLGIFCMATNPGFRRQGAASAILRTLAIWAQLYDARQAYLQVMDENSAAKALYHRVGFKTLYSYHYREKRSG